MNTKFETLFSDKITSTSIMLSTLLLVLSAGVIAISYHAFPPLIPIYNQMPWGIARIGVRLTIFIPFMIALFIYGVNLFLSAFLYNNYTLVSRIVSLTTFCTTALFLLFLLRTLIVVFY
jgi:hypothetical protein